MEISSKLKTRLAAFLVVDILLAGFLIYLFLVRSAVNEADELRRLGATVYPEPFSLQEFQLTDHQGQGFGLADLRGQWSLVFFGFTSCPNICPLTMFELEEFYQELESRDAGDLPQVILATVDPATDTPEVLTEYLSRFHEDFVGLTGTLDELAVLADQLFVARSESSDSGDHGDHGDMSQQEAAVDHSSHISIISPAGELYAVMRAPHRSAAMLQAFAKIATE